MKVPTVDKVPRTANPTRPPSPLDRQPACLTGGCDRRAPSGLLWYHKVDDARARTIDRAGDTTQASKRRCQTISNEKREQKTDSGKQETTNEARRFSNHRAS